MRIEAFTASRDPARPEANEDSFVVLPGRAYAVIDGVSDRTGQRYDGMLSGRYAARLVAATLERLLLGAPPPVESIVPTLTATLHEAYRRHGTLAAAEAGWGARLCCTLALALHDGPNLHLVLVGDSLIRRNGRDLLHMPKDLDRITATLRRHAWHATGGDDALARQAAWHGTAQPDFAALHDAALADCAEALPHVPRADIAHLLRHGIVGAQGDYQNNPESVLGYACLDGFAVPRTLMRIATLPAGGVATLELATDGYPAPGDAPTLAAWEDAFAAATVEDPYRVGTHLSTKATDDRTFVGVSKEGSSFF